MRPLAPPFPFAGEILSASCALFWAVAVLLFKKSGDLVGPVALNLYKNAVGFVLLGLTLLIRPTPTWPAGTPLSDVLTLLASGAIGIAIADSLFLASLNRLGAGRSAIVDCLYSPFVVLCAWFYLGEPVGVSLVAAMGLMAGAILLGAWQPEPANGAPGQGTARSLHVGVAMGVGSMFLMAVGIVLAKPVLNRSDPLWATEVRLAGGLTFLVVQTLLSPALRADARRALVPGRAWRVLFPAAFVGTYLALILWTAGMTWTYTGVASVLNQLSNVFVLFLAWPFLGERITWQKAAAIAAGLAGGVLVVR